MIKSLTVKKDNKEIVYKLKAMKWNYFLNRYYPKAVKVMTIEHLKHKRRKSKN